MVKRASVKKLKELSILKQAEDKVSAELRELRGTIEYLEGKLKVIATSHSAVPDVTLQGVAKQALQGLNATRKLKETEKYYGFQRNSSR